MKKFLIPYIVTSSYRRLREIGSQGGSNIEPQQLGSVEITSIAPCMDMNLVEKCRNNPSVRVLKGLPMIALFKDASFKLAHWYPWRVRHEIVPSPSIAIGDINPLDLIQAMQQLLSWPDNPAGESLAALTSQ